MPVQFGDPLKKATPVRNGCIVTEDRRTLEVQNAERGEIVLNQIVDGWHFRASKALAALRRESSTRRKAAFSTTSGNGEAGLVHAGPSPLSMLSHRGRR